MYVLEVFADGIKIISVQIYSSTNESKPGNNKSNQDKEQ
jgi:hypothetical protein